MHRQIIAKSLFLDCLPLHRQGDLFTCASLKYLYNCLVQSQSYLVGTEDELAALRLADPPPSLFAFEQSQETEDASLPKALSAKSQLKPLPAPHLYVEVSAEENHGLAALLTSARQGLEMYIFRYQESHHRWLWPFMGMRYGPSINDLAHIAVLDPRTLSKMSPNAQKALIQEHASQAGLFIAALQGIREGRWPASVQAKAMRPKKNNVAPFSPSSFAKRSRRQHKKRGPTKGSVRC
ncbi:MAG: hypothetical protein K6G15_02225 [Desulfovibrio sp.]|nr:hypothetical protein [Desulfovibrio sp.]